MPWASPSHPLFLMRECERPTAKSYRRVRLAAGITDTGTPDNGQQRPAQGDIIVEDGDIFGDGANLAARLEGLAEPGSICVSGRVHADALGKVDVAFDDLGEQSLKNIARPLRVFAVRIGGAGAKITPVEKLPLPLPDKPSIAVLPFAI